MTNEFFVCVCSSSSCSDLDEESSSSSALSSFDSYGDALTTSSDVPLAVSSLSFDMNLTPPYYFPDDFMEAPPLSIHCV